MPVRWATTSGNWSNLAIWNDSASLGFPTASDDIFANSFNVNVDQSFQVISLNSTARARDIATPQMTSNNAPSPFVAAASSANSGFDAFRAFDRSLTPTGWQATTSTTTGWLSIDLGSATVIDGYTIYGDGSQPRNPQNWQFQGSNDNVNWTPLHTVTLPSPIAANGLYSIASIGNLLAYRYYRVNVTLNGGATLSITELELYRPFTAALAAGGSFIFNSGSISGSATSTTAALTAGATNLIQVTATTGSVTLNVSSNASPATSAGPLILHSGNCNFNLNGQNFAVTTTGTGNICINKTSAGTINIVGNLSAGNSNNTQHALSSNNGNTVVIGNVVGSTGANGNGINQSAGNVTVTGNVIGGTGVGISLTGAASQLTIVGNVTGGTGVSSFGINFSGTSGSVTGNVTGGSTQPSAHGISATGPVTITGNVTGNTAASILSTANVTVIGTTTGGAVSAGVATTSNNTINQTGTVIATSTACGITSTSTGTVNLTGNMINVSGRQAIFAQNLFISNAATSQWRLFTPGGQDKTLYSADTFPNQPSSANVRSGSLFGPANALSGSMVVPAPSNVRVGVLTDNTVGTGQSLTAADFLAAISSSADPFAQRLRNVATVDTVGSLVTGLNGGF